MRISAPAVPTEDVVCNSCGDSTAREIAQSLDFEYHTCSNEFVFVQCRRCGLVYLKNRPLSSTLNTIYPPDYIPYRFNEHIGSVIAKARDWVQAKKCAPVRRYATSGSTVADIGCGSGELLRILKNHGDPSWSLVGIDFADEAMANLERLGIQGRKGRFETMEWAGDAPQVLIMNQVIEHVDDPAAVVKKAFSILRPGGIFMIETPSLDGWDAKLFQRRHWGGWHTPRHWTLYTEETLGELMRRAGFEVVETTYLLSPNFWLQSVHHFIDERWGMPRLADFFDVSRLPSLVAATALDCVQLAIRQKTSNFRMVGRKRG